MKKIQDTEANSESIFPSQEDAPKDKHLLRRIFYALLLLMTIEMTSREVSNMIARKLRIPVIEVAAGGVADGSEMVIFDLLGFIPPEAYAKHSKGYASTMMDCIKGCTAFDQEVKNRIYPAEEHGWGMDEAEFDKFANELERHYPDVK